MPGLIDLHTHLLLRPYDELSWDDQVLKESIELRTIRGVDAARRTLLAGFTTIRDLGTEGAGFADVGLREAIDRQVIPGPRVFAATRAIVTSGGYGPAGFDPRWRVPQGAQVADGVDGVRKAVRDQVAAGADWIKLYADYPRRPGQAATPTFSLDELRAIVDEARSAGLPVSAHATSDAGIRRAIEAGVDTIEHGYEASEEALRMMAERGVVLCPTLAASEAMARYSGWQAGEPDHERLATSKLLMKRALAAGVTIATGSDAGVFAHGDNVRELELMHAYGMSIPDVIRATTVTAAKVLGCDDLGEVAAGKWADLIAVHEDPLQELSALRQPVAVLRKGQVVSIRPPLKVSDE
jgi:imidazolonepropionase-like amidohydrolase